jgi:hypothetical protein
MTLALVFQVCTVSCVNVESCNMDKALCHEDKVINTQSMYDYIN